MVTAIYLSRLVMCLYTLSSCGVAANVADECKDVDEDCRHIGTRLPLSKCYKLESKCCATCRRLALPIEGCPYGDKTKMCSSSSSSSSSSSHGRQGNVDCYKYSKSCCQTCHLFDTGIPGCSYGDRKPWCSTIGTRFLPSSCYEHSSECCFTCSNFQTNIPGCLYGDRQLWCSNIGKSFSISTCATNSENCCQTCYNLKLPSLMQNDIQNSSTVRNSLPMSTSPSSAEVSIAGSKTSDKLSPARNNISALPVDDASSATMKYSVFQPSSTTSSTDSHLQNVNSDNDDADVDEASDDDDSSQGSGQWVEKDSNLRRHSAIINYVSDSDSSSSSTSGRIINRKTDARYNTRMDRVLPDVIHKNRADTNKLQHDSYIPSHEHEHEHEMADYDAGVHRIVYEGISSENVSSLAVRLKFNIFLIILFIGATTAC